MKVVVRLSAKEELKALPILLRHSPGTILPGRTYIISEESARVLRKEGVKFKKQIGQVGENMTTKRRSLVRGNSKRMTKPSKKLAALEALAQVQGIRPIAEPLAMKAAFWPTDESVDVFVATIRKLRRQGR